MKKLLLSIVCLFVFAFSSSVDAQSPKSKTAHSVRFSPAYGELILRKVDVEAELFDLRQKFTDESLQVKSKTRELEIVVREMNSLRRMKKSAVPKLNETYGKILLQKISAEAKLYDLMAKFTNESVEVKTAGFRLQLLNKELRKWLK